MILNIKATCYGCGMIAGVGCGFNPLRVGRDFNKCSGDTLVDFNADHQFTISLPVVIKGKYFDKAKAKQVNFNSVRCSNLTLLDMFGPKAPDLSEYRASQGYKRCPTCRTIHREGDSIPFCGSVCHEKYEAEVGTILKIAEQIHPPVKIAVKIAVKTVKSEKTNSPKFCKSGSLCLKADRRNRPAPAAPRKQYCGKACQGSFPARAARQQQKMLENTPNLADF